MTSKMKFKFESPHRWSRNPLTRTKNNRTLTPNMIQKTTRFNHHRHLNSQRSSSKNSNRCHSPIIQVWLAIKNRESKTRRLIKSHSNRNKTNHQARKTNSSNCNSSKGNSKQIKWQLKRRLGRLRISRSWRCKGCKGSEKSRWRKQLPKNAR